MCWDFLTRWFIKDNMEFDNLVNLNYGMRNDIGEKYVPKEYFVNLDRFNFDSIIGLDKIKEKTAVNSSQINTGFGIDGGWDYRYIDNNNNAKEMEVIVSGGSVYDITNISTYDTGFIDAGSSPPPPAKELYGIGTAWLSNVSAGNQIRVLVGSTWTAWDTIASVDSDTQITLTNGLDLGSGGPTDLYEISRTIKLSSGLNTGRVSFATHMNKLFIANGKDYPLVFWGAKGIASQMGAPAVEDTGTAGNPNGTYYYACTFVTAGGEEYIGTVSNTITVSSTQIKVNLPIGYAGTLSRNLYRTTASGTVLYLLAQVADNTTLEYTDNITDANLLFGIVDLASSLTDWWKFETSAPFIDSIGGRSLTNTAYSQTTTIAGGKVGNAAQMPLSAGQFHQLTTATNDIGADAGEDFTLLFWLVQDTENIIPGIYFGTPLSADQKLKISILNVNAGTNSGHIQVATLTSSSISTNKAVDGQYSAYYLRRKANVIDYGFLRTSGSYTTLVPEGTLGFGDAFFGNLVISATQSIAGSSQANWDEIRFYRGLALTDINIITYWNNGAGTTSTLAGPSEVIAVNNECPKPYMLQVVDAKLAGCVTDKNPNQLWATESFLETFDNANYVDVTSQSNDNTPLTGMINDYKALVVASEKNIFLVDVTQEPASVKLTRANTGCKNGYTMLNIPPYKAFEGGVLFLSALNDYRLFNSNFAQPIQATDMVIEEGQSGAWVRAIANTLKGLDSDKAFACFDDYKYHVAYGNTIVVFDLRNQGWTTYTGQDSNCLWTYQDKLYSGRTATSFVDEMYSDSSTNFDAIMESGALEADEEIKFFKDLYIYFKKGSYNELELQIIYEDDFQNRTLDIIKINTAQSGNYDPQSYNASFFSTTDGKDDYIVYHINRWTRWIKFIVTSTKGRFLYRGYRLTGERKDRKE